MASRVGYFCLLKLELMGSIMSTELKEGTTSAAILPAKPGQTNCDQKDAKGKPCWGFLKVWILAPDELLKQIPPGEVIFRCQTCLTLYHGSPHRHVHKASEGHKA